MISLSGIGGEWKAVGTFVLIEADGAAAMMRPPGQRPPLVDINHPANANTVRVVNFSPNTPMIDVTITGTLTSTVVPPILYKGVSSYIPGIGVGEASFEVRRSGEITILHTFTATLDDGTINTFFIMGLSQLPGYPVEEKHTVDARWFRVFLPLVIKGG